MAFLLTLLACLWTAHAPGQPLPSAEPECSGLDPPECHSGDVIAAEETGSSTCCTRAFGPLARDSRRLPAARAGQGTVPWQRATNQRE